MASTPAASVRDWCCRAARSSCTTGVWASACNPATRRSSGRGGVHPTLSPLLVTTPGGGLRAVLGTMGGDSQPQILLQLAARLLHAGEPPGSALAAGRWVLASDALPAGFATWAAEGGALPPIVEVEGHAPASWIDGLAERGHRVRAIPALSSQAGHAQAIVVAGEGLAGAADPRTVIGLAAGH